MCPPLVPKNSPVVKPQRAPGKGWVPPGGKNCDRGGDSFGCSFGLRCRSGFLAACAREHRVWSRHAVPCCHSSLSCALTTQCVRQTLIRVTAERICRESCDLWGVSSGLISFYDHQRGVHISE